ncbi:MAG: tRNA guanosine(34) transglycosylase Tgt [Balneolaceae bacterium]|nr:tRNA guanosine(34) transglycosylase Tgt [Balneolaceae bacterium]
MFELETVASSTKARAGKLTTDHGTIQTPFFMPVGTHASVKAVRQDELAERVRAQILLANTYHLYLRPGNEIIGKAGGLHRFMSWERPILTDSGGYQVYSLSDNRELTEKGARFKSHLDGSEHWFTPENVVETQRVLGSDIMMVLDECPPYPAERSYVKESMRLTHRWEERGRQAFLDTEPQYGHRQFQFGIVQGGTFRDLRRESALAVAEMGFEGIAIGGLSVGEPTELMYEMTDLNTDDLPAGKPRYLMGVGTPANLLHAVARGVDMFDCVIPTRNARTGQIFTRNGVINLKNAKWKNHHKALDEEFPTSLCRDYSMAYVHHLFRNDELLGLQLASLHNLTFYMWLMRQMREQIREDTFAGWYAGTAEQVAQKI